MSMTVGDAAADIRLRAFAMGDYEAAYRFWGGIAGLCLNESDTPRAIGVFLRRNPGFSAVALDGDGGVVGTVLCGHNGRAGSLHHLAVAPQRRGRGLGRRLVAYALARLAKAGVPRCNIFVYNDNYAGNRFWLEGGWDDPHTWRVLQKRVGHIDG